MWLELCIVSSVNWICCGQYGRSGIQRSGDSRLCNRYGLLLHHFVNVCSISFIHFVKLIDAADAGIRQNEGTTFKNNLAGIWIFEDGSCETNSRRSLTRGVNGSWSKRRDMLQKLRLGNTWVTHQKAIDLSPDFHSILHFFSVTSNHQKQQSLFDFFHTKNFWAN